MSSIVNHRKASACNQNKNLDPVSITPPTYNLDDFAFPTFVPRALGLANLTQDVRTWRELSDYIRANLRKLPPYTLERALSLQADYTKAGPAERLATPAITLTANPVVVQGGKGRGRLTHREIVSAKPSRTNIKVPGAAQSQGLAHIAIELRELPSEAAHKESIPAKVSAGPIISSRGTSKQTAVSTITKATYGVAKPAAATIAKGAPWGFQKPATTSPPKGNSRVKSVSVNLSAKRAKTLKFTLKGHELGKSEAAPEKICEPNIPPPMGELIDLSIPPSAKVPPLPLPPLLQEISPFSSIYKTDEDARPITALAAIPALIPAKKYDLPPLSSAKEPPAPKPTPAPMPPHLRILSMAALPPPSPRRIPSMHSSSTWSRSPPPYSRSPSPEQPKPAKPALPEQAGRYYLVWKDRGLEYVWVAGAQRGDRPPRNLVGQEF